MTVLDNRSAVMDDVIDATLHHLAVEVVDLVTSATSSGAELLKHLLEGYFLANVFRVSAIGNPGVNSR